MREGQMEELSVELATVVGKIEALGLSVEEVVELVEHYNEVRNHMTALRNVEIAVWASKHVTVELKDRTDYISWRRAGYFRFDDDPDCVYVTEDLNYDHAESSVRRIVHGMSAIRVPAERRKYWQVHHDGGGRRRGAYTLTYEEAQKELGQYHRTQI